MSTLSTRHIEWNAAATTQQHTNLWTKWLALADTQAPRKTLWFLISLVSQGVLFLPIPAVLMYYYDAPIFILGVTLCLFFANFIAGMGGSNIRTILTLFALSIAIHLIMVMAVIL